MSDKQLQNATKAQLIDALLSACQELAIQLEGLDMPYQDTYISAGNLNNQVLRHLNEPDTIVEG